MHTLVSTENPPCLEIPSISWASKFLEQAPAHKGAQDAFDATGLGLGHRILVDPPVAGWNMTRCCGLGALLTPSPCHFLKPPSTTHMEITIRSFRLSQSGG